MIERARNLRLAYETAHGISIRSSGTGQKLQRDLALQTDVFREIHHAHAAGAEGRLDLEVPDERAGRQGHISAVRLQTATQRRTWRAAGAMWMMRLDSTPGPGGGAMQMRGEKRRSR